MAFFKMLLEGWWKFSEEKQIEELEVQKPSPKLLEATQMMEMEPGSTYAQIMQIKKRLSQKKVQQIIQRVDRCIPDVEVWDATMKNIDDAEVKIKGSGIGQFYDPLTPLTEIENFTTQVKCEEQITEHTRFWEFAKLAAVLAMIFATIGKFTKKHQGVSVWKIACLAGGIKIISGMEKIATILKFKHVELTRIRFALTTGNVVNLCMQLAEKLNYLERRSSEFHRFLQ